MQASDESVSEQAAPQEAAELFGAEGPLARHVSGFQPREAQQKMASAVADALRDNGLLMVEAGTGTGKTFAYLVPALAAGQRVIISTATRTLQDQLYHRDLPLVRKALAAPVNTCLLKGRANYLCLYRMDAAAPGEGDAVAADLARVRQWAGRTATGDISELTDIAENAPVWPQVTSTIDNCLGQECPRFNDCHVVRARRAAQEADVLVVNHHLLFADMALRQEGFGELLPGMDAVILDEAHQVEEIASRFFGLSVSSRQLLDLCRDTVAEHTRGVGDMPDLVEAAWRLEGRVRQARLALGAGQRKAPWGWWLEQEGVREAFRDLVEGLETLVHQLKPAAERTRGLENCHRRALESQARLQALGREEDRWVDWAETSRHGFVLQRTPLEVASTLREFIDSRPCAWIFTSATLSVNGSFEHTTRRLGVPDADTLQLQSPFDFASRALLYLPGNMPDPNTQEYHEAVIQAALPVIEASGGRAFFLFTSHRALQWCAGRLRGRLEYPLLVQGEAPRGELIRRFREYGNAVLLGSQTFWEGVDVRGTALEVVIIDRLPFAAPSDPVLQARLEALRHLGGNPFRDYQLPEAVISLKQGVGRLIRDVEDRGVVMLCDPRLSARAYGRLFLNSLPPLARTSSLEDVQAFFVEQAGPVAGSRG